MSHSSRPSYLMGRPVSRKSIKWLEIVIMSHPYPPPPSHLPVLHTTTCPFTRGPTLILSGQEALELKQHLSC